MSEIEQAAAIKIAQPLLAYTVPQAAAAGAGCPTRIYKALAEGRLKGRKHGRTTLILHGDLQDYLSRLPEYRAPGRPVAPRNGAEPRAA